MCETVGSGAAVAVVDIACGARSVADSYELDEEELEDLKRDIERPIAGMLTSASLTVVARLVLDALAVTSGDSAWLVAAPPADDNAFVFVRPVLTV